MSGILVQSHMLVSGYIKCAVCGMICDTVQSAFVAIYVHCRLTGLQSHVAITVIHIVFDYRLTSYTPANYI